MYKATELHFPLCLHRPERLSFFKYLLCVSFVALELKNSLSSFVEKETILDYDREAELALQRLTTGDVDVNKLTSAWTRSYVEVITHFIVFLSC